MPVHCPLSVPIDMKRSATERAWGKLVQPRLRLGHSLRARMHYSTLHSDMANMFSQMIHEFMSWWIHCTIALRQIDGTCKALFKAEQVMTSKAQTFGLMLVHVVNCGNMHNTYTIQAGSPHKGLWFEIVFDAAQDVGTQIHMSSVFFFLHGILQWPCLLDELSTSLFASPVYSTDLQRLLLQYVGSWNGSLDSMPCMPWGINTNPRCKIFTSSHEQGKSACWMFARLLCYEVEIVSLRMGGTVAALS